MNPALGPDFSFVLPVRTRIASLVDATCQKAGLVGATCFFGYPDREGAVGPQKMCCAQPVLPAGGAEL
jgi:hypothetical protein